MTKKRKRGKKRLFHVPAQAVHLESERQQDPQEAESLALVLIELTPGKASVGFRLNEETVALFAEDLAPEEAARLAANIAQGRISFEELQARPWREILYPAEQEQEARHYKYTLPEDDQEVIVSGAAMALLDLVKRPFIREKEQVEAHALYNCEMSRQHSREPLTNDYESWKALFIPNYVAVYLRAAQGMDLSKMREIAERYDILTVLAEYRNIVKMIFFPDLADLEALAMEYEGIVLTPHRTVEGYTVAFVYNHLTQRTSPKATPTEAFKEAQQTVRDLKGTH